MLGNLRGSETREVTDRSDSRVTIARTDVEGFFLAFGLSFRTKRKYVKERKREREIDNEGYAIKAADPWRLKRNYTSVPVQVAYIVPCPGGSGSGGGGSGGGSGAGGGSGSGGGSSSGGPRQRERRTRTRVRGCRW